MKKYIYICCLILLGMNGWAQISDWENWILVFDERFDGDRSWDTTTFMEQNADSSYHQRWDCMTAEWWPRMITTGAQTHQAYQPSHACWGEDHKMRLMAECKSTTPLFCTAGDYQIPQGAQCDYEYDGNTYDDHPSIYYYSGAIETSAFDNWFGYYEIQCKLPVYPGEASAFWLVGSGPNTYEEIDIFEHSSADAKATNGNLATGYSCGIWRNPDGTNYSLNDNTCANNYSKKFLSVPDTDDLTNEHVFGLEWFPNRITWFCDGEVVNECTNRDTIPQYPLRLKVTHPVPDSAFEYNARNSITPKWLTSDPVVINYIKHYRPYLDCDTDAVIHNGNELVNLSPGVKRSITIESDAGVNVQTGTNKVLMASEGITITRGGEFTIPQGAQVVFRIFECIDNDSYNNQ